MKYLHSDGQEAQALRDIREATAALADPPLLPLRQTLQQMRSDVTERRARLVLDAIAIREDGFSAAARIALSVDEKPSPARPGYFAQFEETRL